jgi:hypothetical protein
VLSDNVFINGKIEILKVEIVNEALVPVSWAFPEDKLYVLVTLNNPTGYNVDSINATITDLVKLDDNRWYYEAGDLGSGLSILPLATLTYSNEYISAKTLTCSDKESWVYRVASNDAKCISTPDDLKNMGDGYYYELANDIDLAGIEWQGTSFCGVLNGKGYAIKNMSFVGTVKNTTAYLGLFSTGTGIIENLNIVEATIIAEVAYDEGEVYEAFCGAIVARADGRMELNGCTVDEYSTIGVRTIGTVKLYVGGLVGASLYDGIKITNSENNGGVSGVSAGYYAFVGGLLGHANGVVNLEGCLNTGSVSSTYIAGGLVGSSDDIIAKNCSNSGSITAITEVGSSCEYAGGIVGVTNDATIKSCTNSGSISGFQYAGGLVAYMHNAIVEDCTNSGSITGLEGAAGLLSHGESAKITGCKNTGNVSGRTAGGLLEIAHIVTIESCANSGSVSATGSDNPYAGGLVGAFYGDANATVANSVNSGSVSADYEYGASVAGGLVGYVWANATVTIEDCVNGGSIREGSGYGSIGGVLASLWSGSTATIENCYSLFSFSGGYNGEVCTVEELNSATFYTDTLGWSEDVWDFSDLDVANGKYPTLK